MNSENAKLFITSLICLLAFCLGCNHAITNIHALDKYCTSMIGKEIALPELNRQLSHFKVDTIHTGNNEMELKIFSAQLITNSDTCWYTIEYNNSNNTIIDAYKSCQ